MRALALSTHPGPALAVTVVSVLVAIGVGLDGWRVAVLGFAVLAGQASIGLSNDWLDAERDSLVGRTDKPIASGLTTAARVRTAAFVTLVAALGLSAVLGWLSLATHAVFLAFAWAYNLGLKRTALSVVPYIVSFGILPLVVTVSAAEPRAAAWWGLVAGAGLGVAAHFANVLPDLDDDERTGIRGLPHRMGVKASGIVIAAAICVASGALAVGASTIVQTILLGIAGAVGMTAGFLALTRPSGRLLFRLIMAGAVIDAGILATIGSRLLV